MRYICHAVHFWCQLTVATELLRQRAETQIIVPLITAWHKQDCQVSTQSELGYGCQIVFRSVSFTFLELIDKPRQISLVFCPKIPNSHR